MGKSLVLRLLPELDESDLTWAAIGSALSGKLARFGQFTALLLFPELDESDLTWAAVRAAVSGRVVGLGKSLALRLLPELDESDLTWAAIGSALSGKLARFGQFTALLLFPELDESDLTWAAIGAALSGKLARFGQFTALLLFPELDKSDLTWAAIGAALTRKIQGLGSSLALFLLPELNKDDLTWETIRQAAQAKILSLAGDLSALVVGVALRFPGATVIETQWAKFQLILDNLGLGDLGIFDPFNAFWSGFTEGAEEAGGSTVLKELIESLLSLFASLVTLGAELGKLQLAIVFAPIIGLIAAIGGYKGDTGEILVQFLEDLGAWTGGTLVTELSETAAVIMKLADAISYFTTYAGMPLKAGLALLAGFQNPGEITPQEIRARRRRYGRL